MVEESTWKRCARSSTETAPLCISVCTIHSPRCAVLRVVFSFCISDPIIRAAAGPAPTVPHPRRTSRPASLPQRRAGSAVRASLPHHAQTQGGDRSHATLASLTERIAPDQLLHTTCGADPSTMPEQALRVIIASRSWPVNRTDCTYEHFFA